MALCLQCSCHDPCCQLYTPLDSKYLSKDTFNETNLGPAQASCTTKIEEVALHVCRARFFCNDSLGYAVGCSQPKGSATSRIPLQGMLKATRVVQQCHLLSKFPVFDHTNVGPKFNCIRSKNHSLPFRSQRQCLRNARWYNLSALNRQT